MKYTIDIDKHTREIEIHGPEGYIHRLDTNAIAPVSFHAITELLSEAFEAGHAAGLKERAGLATKKSQATEPK